MGDEDSDVEPGGADGEGRDRTAAEPDEDDGGQDPIGRVATDADDDEPDEKVLGTAPDAGAIEEPTTDSEQASREARWGLQQGLAIGLVSIAVGLLVAFGLMQATGLVSVPAPSGASAIANWAVFLAIAVLLVAAFAYSQWRT